MQKNYITSRGYKILQDELNNLITNKRPILVQTITWAASNGDRSENGDYIYGKKQLRELDKRIHILTKKLSCAEVVDSSIHRNSDIIFFGAKVLLLKQNLEILVQIVGQDEIDPSKNLISWTSPLAKLLLKKRVGDVVYLSSPSLIEEIKILSVKYD